MSAPADTPLSAAELAASLEDRLVAAAGERTHLVWSYQHHAWWCPDGRGYTVDTLNAGLYTEDEARGIARGSGGEEVTYALADVLAGKVWARKPGCLQDIIDADLRALLDEVARLSAEVATMRPVCEALGTAYIARYHLGDESTEYLEASQEAESLAIGLVQYARPIPALDDARAAQGVADAS